MVSLTRNLVAAVLMFCGAAAAYSQTRTPKKPAGTIAGKVTIKGKAAPGVVVGLRASEQGSAYELLAKATSDQEGKYRLTEIPAGSFQITPLSPAFVVSSVNGSRGKALILGEGESVDEIDFALIPGGVVTGKLTDADGHPVIEQRVGLVLADQPPNQRGLIYPINSAQTDDRGIYRMFGIAAGRYKVVAGQGRDGVYMPGGSSRTSYLQTYYPDVSDLAKATVVEVTEGSEASNIDIVLGRADQKFVVSGRVINGENDQPLANVRVALQSVVNGQPVGLIGSSAGSDGAGEFRVENLAAGKYDVLILPQRDSDVVHADKVRVEVVDQDVAGLIIKTSKGASVSGTIVLETTDDKAVFARLVQLQVMGVVTQSEAGSTNFSHTALVNADGSFYLTGLDAGTAHLSLYSPQGRNLQKGFTVTRIERDGLVQARGLDLKKGEQITGVRLVVKYGNAVIHGAVQLQNGSLPDGGRIFVTVRKSGDTVANNVRQAELDARNHFIMDGLPAGTYDLSASFFMPTAMKTRPPRATQQVTVSDGAITEVTLVLDMSPPSDPVRPPVLP